MGGKHTFPTLALLRYWDRKRAGRTRRGRAREGE